MKHVPADIIVSAILSIIRNVNVIILSIDIVR